MKNINNISKLNENFEIKYDKLKYDFKELSVAFDNLKNDLEFIKDRNIYLTNSIINYEQKINDNNEDKEQIKSENNDKIVHLNYKLSNYNEENIKFLNKNRKLIDE